MCLKVRRKVGEKKKRKKERSESVSSKVKRKKIGVLEEKKR